MSWRRMDEPLNIDEPPQRSSNPYGALPPQPPQNTYQQPQNPYQPTAQPYAQPCAQPCPQPCAQPQPNSQQSYYHPNGQYVSCDQQGMYNDQSAVPPTQSKYRSAMNSISNTTRQVGDAMQPVAHEISKAADNVTREISRAFKNLFD